MLDGIELLFTVEWETNQEWTLNPLVPGTEVMTGIKMQADREELNLTYNNPINGGLAPPDAPKMWEEAQSLDPNEATAESTGFYLERGRASIAIAQYDKWIDTGMRLPSGNIAGHHRSKRSRYRQRWNVRWL